MNWSLYLLVAMSMALTGCDFGEDKIIDKIAGGGAGGSTKRYFNVGSTAAAEGDTLVFTVSFNRSHSETMTVPYSTAGVTATSGARSACGVLSCLCICAL